jgi:hypothetical protein
MLEALLEIVLLYRYLYSIVPPNRIGREREGHPRHSCQVGMVVATEFRQECLRDVVQTISITGTSD